MQNLLKSREFWALVVALVVSVLVALVPNLASSKDTIINALMALVGVIIVSIGAEKVAAANSSGSTKIERVEATKMESLPPSPPVKYTPV